MLSTTSSLSGILKQVYGDPTILGGKISFLKHITNRPYDNFFTAILHPGLPKVQLDIFQKLDHMVIQEVSRAVFGEIAIGLGLPDQNAYKMKEAIKDEIKSLTQETN